MIVVRADCVSEVVLDASALLALLNSEKGNQAVADALPDAGAARRAPGLTRPVNPSYDPGNG